MTVESLLQFLNLPILGGVLYVAYVAGGAVRELKEHERRLLLLEERAWSNRAASARPVSLP